MGAENKMIFDISIGAGEEITKETMEELSNGRGEEDE